MDRRLSIVLAVVLVLAGFALFYFRPHSDFQTNEFFGNIIQITDKEMVLEGNFPVNDRVKEPVSVKVSFDDDTVITKTIYYRPSPEELKKTDGVWYPKDAEKITENVALKDLANYKSWVVKVDAGRNIYGKKSFKAEKILFEDTDWKPEDRPVPVQ